MKYIFSSNFADRLYSFVAQKELLGHEYNTSGFHLKAFDGFVLENFPKETALTREIAAAWATLRNGEHPNGLMRRITPVRQFAKYLNSIGEDAYVIPGSIPGRQIRYIPHIYTDKELSAFFDAADSVTVSIFSPTRHLVIPAYFRTLYCCGMRKSETRLLMTEDVNLEEGTIFIRESKGYHDRLIPMSDDLTVYLQKYADDISRIVPHRKAFFPNKDGMFFGDCTPGVWFNEIWGALPESRTYCGSKPRIHDFRHTFAVKRLNLWVAEGKDVSTLIPHLSEYLGHTTFWSTDYYLHLVPEFFPMFCEKTRHISESVIPEVCHE